MTDPEALKRAAAKEAVKSVGDGEVIGIGSGTTIKHFIAELAGRIKRETLRILAVPTSYDTLMLASDCGVKLTTLEEHPNLSKCFDGADKVDRDLNMIKGGGGCHTREKIVAVASEKVCILVDNSKVVDRITGDSPIPVEVIPFSYKLVSRKLSEVGGTLKLRYAGSSKMGPVIGDNGGFIGDVVFQKKNELSYLDNLLNSTPGIIEHGLFLKIADLVYVAHENRVELLKRR
ncbi:MAG: ribose-5-phosphate isomerase RpiA [Promethearchaeati archaeon SRVP18_Atabeyarchaeia-1]